MACALAAWLTSWSSASVTKSMNITSITGRMPDWAAPTATPQMAASRDRRVQHALGAELVGQPGGRAVGAALGHVLADHEHARVGAHRAARWASQ